MRILAHAAVVCLFGASLLTLSDSARAEVLLFNSEHDVAVSELLDLLDIVPGISTWATVSTTANGTFGTSANVSGDGRLTCRVEGAEVILAAGSGPAASGTCFARVCTGVLGLVEVCGTTPLTIQSTACFTTGPGAIDPGCSTDAPTCTGGPGAVCVGCLADIDCGSPSGTFGIGLGQTANVTLGLLNELLGLDLGVPLSTVQVGAAVNGPFSDEALLNAESSCAIAADGSVDLIASSDVAGESTCYVQACVPLLGSCLVVDLGMVVDGCLLGGSCDPVAACDTATNTCVACRDNQAAGYIDSGCSSASPVCNDGGAAPACVECMQDVDCSGKLLTVALGPDRTTVLEIGRVLEVMRLSSGLVPSTVKVGATADGPFSDAALLDADGALSGCSVDADGNILLTAAGIEGDAVCHVQVCASLLGNAVATCLEAPVDVKVDLCVLDNSCDLEPHCDGSYQCSSACVDSKPAGGIDRGCDADLPACAGSCVECQADADCLPKRPLLDLDLEEVGEVLRADYLAALDLDVSALVDSVKVGATVNGPFADTTTLDVQGDVAQCMVDLDGNVEVVATSTIYGAVTCHVEVCVALLAGVDTCLVLPIDINVDRCAADDSCLPSVCDAGNNQCAACTDSGSGIDHGCDAARPMCAPDGDGDNRCVECDDDSDCGGGDVCTVDKRCEACADTTAGGIDRGCDDDLPACDAAASAGATCVACTEDADCSNGLCDEATNTCDTCQNTASGGGLDAGCDAQDPVCVASTTGGDDFCADCGTDGDCPSGEHCNAANACEACSDTANGGVDHGCAAGLPACDVAPLAGGNPICVACTADADCATGVCDEATRTCVECAADADCATGELCSATHTCEACRNTKSGGVDFGCASPLPACDTAPLGGGIPTCVECTADADCASRLCDEATRTCDTCQDTASGHGRDAGCVSARPMCLPGANGGDDFCAECGADGDCAAGERCSGAHTCEACQDTTIGHVDQGCASALPACDIAPVGGGVPSCVECTADADCASAVCDEARRVCVACRIDDQCDDDETCDDAGNCVAVDAPLVARDDSYSVGFGAMLSVNASAGVLANDSAPAGASGLQARMMLDTIFDSQTEGTLTLGADGGFVFEPVAGFSGRISFDYQAWTARGDNGVATVVIDVAANVAPDAGDDIVETPEDTPVLIVVTANDRDREDQALRVDDVGEPLFGTVELLPDGSVLYHPPANFVGRDSFDYTLCDAFDACSQGTVSVTVTPVDDAPLAADDFAVAEPGKPIVVDVLANDGDPDGDALHIGAIDSDGLQGTVVEGADGLTFTPAAGFQGDTGFGYQACDDDDVCGSAHVTIQVGGTLVVVIDALDDAVTTAENTPVTFDVLANDVYDGDGALAIAAWQKPKFGMVALSTWGEITYRPALGFVGEDVFTYTACVERRCDYAVVTVTVTDGGNAPPIAVDDETFTLHDTPVALAVTANDFDPDGDSLTVQTVGVATFGLAKLGADGRVYYTPAAAFIGSDAFTVQISDGHGGLDESRVTVQVLGTPNVAPVALDDSFTIESTAANAEPASSSFDVLANDTDADGDALSIDVIVQPEHGSATLGADGSIDYRAPAGFAGLDYIIYRVTDGRGGYDIATVTVIVGSQNLGPLLADDVATTLEDTLLAIAVLANDSDADGHIASVELVTAPLHGEALALADGRFSYAPDGDFVGDDAFSYRACDDSGACAVADVSIEVTPVNDAPVAHDDQGTMLAGVAVSLDVLANDFDVDGDALSIGTIGEANVGTVSLEDGRVAVIAPLDFGGVVSFDYEACDPDGLCSKALVHVTVAGQMVPPVVANDHGSTEANHELVLDVLANDSDPQGDTLAISSVTRPDHGATRIEDNQVVYTPSEDYVGLDGFQYIACDVGGLCAQARVSIEVVIPRDNHAPDAADDLYDATGAGPHRIDVLANDSDSDGDQLRVISVTAGTQGVVSIGVDGKVWYVPGVGAFGGEALSYTACDSWNVCDTAELEIVLPEAPPGYKFEVAGGVTCANGGTSTLLALLIGLAFIAARRVYRSAPQPR